MDVLYAYRIGGREYRSNRFDFMAFLTDSGGRGKEETRTIVSRYRPGSEATCYVDPTDPTEAVLSRQIEWPALDWVPLAFVVLPSFALYRTVRELRSTLADRRRSGRALDGSC